MTCPVNLVLNVNGFVDDPFERKSGKWWQLERRFWTRTYLNAWNDRAIYKLCIGVYVFDLFRIKFGIGRGQFRLRKNRIPVSLINIAHCWIQSESRSCIIRISLMYSIASGSQTSYRLEKFSIPNRSNGSSARITGEIMFHPLSRFNLLKVFCNRFGVFSF